MTSKNLPQHDITALVFSSLYNTIQNALHKQACSDKKVERPKANGKCTNGTNYRSRVLPVFFIYHLPELSRTMAYTTRNTVNRLARNKLNLNPVVIQRSKE